MTREPIMATIATALVDVPNPIAPDRSMRCQALGNLISANPLHYLARGVLIALSHEDESLRVQRATIARNGSNYRSLFAPDDGAKGPRMSPVMQPSKKELPMLPDVYSCQDCHDTHRCPVCGGVGSHPAPEGEKAADRRICTVCHATGRCRQCAHQFPGVPNAAPCAAAN